jgi:UDP-N-acetylmuramate--alanine ligase
MDQGFQIMKRAEVLGLITKNTFCFAVAGTHGKTTTSAILGHIMQPYKATSFLGGISENYESNLIFGAEEISVVEADEFDQSFLQLSPNIACITSMDADHLDIYGEHSSLVDSFKKFANQVTEVLIVAKGTGIEGLSYALNEDADYKITNIRQTNGYYIFDVKTPNSEVSDIEFSLPGKHNIMNALAAIAMADSYGVSLESIKKSLRSFKGVERRFSYKIKTDALTLIDDYAHHPTEINVVYDSIKELYPTQKNVVIFQPHLFSRTKDFIEDFAIALAQFDEILLLDIYPAREEPIEGVSSLWLLEKILNKNKKITHKNNLVKDIKNSNASIVAMLGAGDIGKMVEDVKTELMLA